MHFARGDRGMLCPKGALETQHQIAGIVHRFRPPHHWHIASGAVGVPHAPEWLLVLLFAIAIAAAGLWWSSTRI